MVDYLNIDESRQINKLVGCNLERIGTLEFEHSYGACTNFSNQKIYLCFSQRASDTTKCRFANSPESPFEETAETVYSHSDTSIASSRCE